MLTVFFAFITPPAIGVIGVHWLQAVLLLMQEAVLGLALGLMARLAYAAVQQGGMIAAQQMGFNDAGVLDPVSGVQAQAIAMFFEMLFALLFLAAGGHYLLLKIIGGSFDAFPIAAVPDIGLLTNGIVVAGSTMLLFALKIAAPILAAFLVLSVLLCILARVLPEMDILMFSFPLRVGTGLFLAATITPSLNAFTVELAKWMKTNLTA